MYSVNESCLTEQCSSDSSCCISGVHYVGSHKLHRIDDMCIYIYILEINPISNY